MAINSDETIKSNISANMVDEEDETMVDITPEENEEVQEDEEIPETENQDDSEDNSEDEDDFEDEESEDDDLKRKMDSTKTILTKMVLQMNSRRKMRKK